MIRYALVGCGMMAQEHVRYLNLLPEARISALCDPEPEMRRQTKSLIKNDVAMFDSHQDLIQQALADVYVVCTPNDTHYSIMQDLLTTKRAILCEKPLCTTLENCKALREASKDYPAPIWVAMEYRYMEPIKQLASHVKKGTIGRPRMISITEHRYPFLPKVHQWNRLQKRTGGTLVEKCCHFWDLMRFLLASNPYRVYASAGNDVNHRDEAQPVDINDNAYVILDFENGCRGMLDLCMYAEARHWQETVRVTGDLGQVTAFIPPPQRFQSGETPRSGAISLALRASKTETFTSLPIDDSILEAGDHYGATFIQHERFLNLVQSAEGEADVTLNDGTWAVAIGAAAETSAKTGQALTIKAHDIDS